MVFSRLKHTIHVSWIIASLSFACIGGIALAAWLQSPLWSELAWLVTAGALLFIAFLRPTGWSVLLAIAAGLLVGIWRGSVEQVNLSQYQPLYGQIITITGAVSDDTSYGPHGDQRIMIKDVHIGKPLYAGQVWISSNNASSIKRADIVTIHGRLGKGFGSIAASMFNATIDNVVHPLPGDIGLRIRDWFSDGIRVAIPEPQASLASGYLVGQRSALPEDLDNQLKVVGLTHAVVASGYNLTILVSFARQLLAGISKYLATLAGAAMIGGFIMLSGLSPSMARAGLVTSLGLAAWYYGRKIHPFVLLPFAAALTALANPSYVRGDIGWYLSFMSFAGVIVLAPLLQHYLWGNARVGFVKQTLIDTMSAQLATLPIMVFAFGHYSPYALLANLLVLPLVPLTMALTFIAGIAGLALPAIAQLVGLPATIVLRYMTSVVKQIAGLPGAQGDITVGVLALVIGYAVLCAGSLLLWRKTKHNFHSYEPNETVPNLTAT